mgnify:FL=1
MTCASAPLVLVTALIVAGCQQAGLEDARAVDRLVAGAPDNTEAVVQMVDQQCVGRASDRDAFAAALDASGWNFEQTQEADPDNHLSVDVWQSREAQIVMGEVVEGRIFGCWLAIGSEFSPDSAALATALTEKYGAAKEDGVYWEFRGPHGSLHKLDIGGETTGDYGTSLFVEEWR